MFNRILICALLFLFAIFVSDIQSKEAKRTRREIKSLVVAIYIISDRVARDQAYINDFRYKYEWDPKWICHSDIQEWPKDYYISKTMMVFPDKWNPENMEPVSSRCTWLSYKEQLERGCSNGLSTQKTNTELWNMNRFEPRVDFASRLLARVIASLASECSKYGSSYKYKINIFINYAEKSLVNAIPELLNANEHIGSIQVVPLTLMAANYYYYYPLASNATFRYFDEYSKKTNYIERPMNSNWHQIYIFAFRKTLSREKIMDVVNAAQRSMSNYYMQKSIKNASDEEISVMMVSKRQFKGDLYTYRFCDNFDEFSNINTCFGLFQSWWDFAFDSDLIENVKDDIFNLTKISIMKYQATIFGAQLPPAQMADAPREQVQPKPRIVLITDFVEMKFLNSNLTFENGFELKIYALNNATFEHFQGKADFVKMLDPDNPGPIPFMRKDEEPSSPTERPPIIVEVPIKGSSIKTSLIVLISLGSTFLIILLFIFIIVYRRRLHRVNWLHQLEQFKTEHLYNVYVNEKRNSCKKGEKVDSWELGWDRVILTTEYLGKGAFGEVRKANLTTISSTNKDFKCETTVAVKMLPIHATEKTRKNFIEEIKIMKMLGNGHQCVVKMLGCMSKGEGALGIVLEFCARGSLLDHLNKSKIAEGEERQKLCRPFSRWAWQIADGMVFLAGKNLVHRDLAARNVLLDENLIAKISDFGLCISLDEKLAKESEKEKLPLLCLAPECLEQREFSEKSDVWSFGLLLHELYTFGQNPFSGIEFDNLLNYIRAYCPKKPEICPEKIFDLMQKCLQIDETVRPGFLEIKEKLTEMLEIETADYGYMALDMQIDTQNWDNQGIHI